MKHPGHTYGGFVPSISERGMTSKPMTTTQLLLRFPRNGNSMLVNPNIGEQIRPSYHAVLILQNREKNNYRCNMFKVTCLVDPRRTVGTPQKFGLENPRTTVPAQCYLS
jgi:hypothetical protein